MHNLLRRAFMYVALRGRAKADLLCHIVARIAAIYARIRAQAQIVQRRSWVEVVRCLVAAPEAVTALELKRATGA